MKLGHLINHGSMALNGSREKCHGIYLRCCIAGSTAWTDLPICKALYSIETNELNQHYSIVFWGHCHESGSEVERSCENLIFAVYFAIKNVSQLPLLVSRASPDGCWQKKNETNTFSIP